MGKRSVFLMAKPSSMRATRLLSLRFRTLSRKSENTLRVGPINELSIDRESIGMAVVGLRGNNGYSLLLRPLMERVERYALSFYDCTDRCRWLCTDRPWT